MQRDLKVGLSLGVLVLGVVGALLFRREQPSVTHQPTLKTARKIDERIAEHPRTPYMTGDVEFEPEATTNSDADNQLSADGRPAHAVPPSWLNDEEDPFQITKTDQGKLDFRHPAGTDSGAIAQLQPRSTTAQRTAHAAVSESQTHVIQSGDSLSALAERYLGNQGRFQEIYDANRDVLTDANRLPLGATIVIPATSKASSKTQAAGPPTGTSPRTPVSHTEKVRGTITDISTIEPIAPPPADGKSADSHPQPEKDKAAAAPASKTHEAKKFVSPSRLPFANHNSSAASNPHRKVSAGEGDGAGQPKPSASDETKSSTTADPQYYQVRKGDSLEKISTRIYGNAKRAADIFAANRSLLASPDAVREGQELVLPE